MRLAGMSLLSRTSPPHDRTAGRGRALALLAAAMVLSMTTWLVPLLRDAVTWRWAFAALAPGPALGVAVMLRLRARPESRRIARGRG